MTGRRSLGIVAVALAIATLAGSRGGAVVEADRVDRVDRVLIVSLPGIGWADIDDGETPNLDRLFSRSAIANLSTRAPTLRTDLAAGYATLGAGDKAVGSSTAVDGEAFGVAEPFADGTAGEAFTRRTGRRATRGIVHLGIPSITAENEDSLWDADVGALGGALARHGYSRAVIANADIEPAELIAPALGSTWHREAVLALVEPGGTLPAGRVDDSLLESAPAAPFGQQLDRAAVVEAFDTVFTGRSVVLVEGSDLARADAAAATQNVAQRLESRERALRETDTLVGALLARVDPTRDAVIVLGPAPRSVDNDALTVVAVSARGFRAGLLRSPTTLRAGSVQLMDIAPSILGLVGVERPDSMRGRPVEATGAGTLADRRASLVDTDAAASFRTELRDPLTRGFVALQVVLVAGAILVLLRRTDRAVTPITWLALSTLGCITSVYIARLVPFHDIGLVAYFLFLLGASAALGGTFLFFGMRRGAVDATVAGLGTLVGVLVVDVATGAHLQFNSGFGFSPEVAGRFIGLGNISYAFLAAGSVLLAGLVAHRIGGRRGTWCGISVLGVAVVIDGAPFLGADVGGVLTMVPAFALTAAMLLGHRIRARAVVALFAVTGLAVAVAAFADSLRPAAQRTHLGRLVEQVRGEGSSAFTTVVVRKLEMNLSTLGSSDWRPIVVAGLALIAFLVWSRDRHLARLLTRIPELRASLVGLAVVAVLGYALNDQGVVIPAAMLAVSSPVLVTLVLLRPPAAPEEPTAASTASSASAPPRP